MKRHLILLLGTLVLGISAQAQTVLINSWENSLEGWSIEETGIWSTTGFSTNDVTQGSYSWNLTAASGPDYGAAIEGPSSTGLTAILGNTASISIDVATPIGGSFGYYQQWDLVINQPGGIGYTSVDGYCYCGGGYPNIGGSNTLTWTIPASISSGIAASPLAPCQIVFQIGGGFNSSVGNTMYLDNLRANLIGPPQPAQLWVRETFNDVSGEIFPAHTPFYGDINSVGFNSGTPWITNPRESGLNGTPTNTTLMAVRGNPDFDFPVGPDTMGLPSALDGVSGALVEDNSGGGYGLTTLWTAGDFMTRQLAPNNFINFNVEGEYWFAMTIGMIVDAQYSGDIPASGAGGIGFADGSDTNANFVAIGITGTNVYLGPSNMANPFGTTNVSKSVYISQGTLGQAGDPNSLIYNPYNDPAYGPGAKDFFGNPICTQDGGPSLTNYTGGPYYVSAYGTNAYGAARLGQVYGDGIVVLGHLTTHADGTATMDAKTYIAALGDQMDLPTNGFNEASIQWDCSYAFYNTNAMTRLLVFENGEFPFYLYSLRASSNLANVLGIDPGYIAISPKANTFSGFPVNMTNEAAEAAVSSSTYLSSVDGGNYGTLNYQWYQNGMPITGATAQFLNIASASTNDPSMPAGTDAGTYTSVATDPTGTWNSVTTPPVVVTVTVEPPLMVTGFQLFANQESVNVSFNEPGLTGYLVSNNYTLNDGMTVTNVVDVTGSGAGTVVQLQTTPIPIGTKVTLTINGITNGAGGGIAANTTETFWTDIPGPGVANDDFWAYTSGSDTQEYFNLWLPANPAPIVGTNYILTSWAGPTSGVNVGGGQYFGGRMYGWFIPPVTTNYVFYVCCDDGGRLSLSTNSDPANLCVIAATYLWTDGNGWTNYASDYPTGDHRGDGTSTTFNAGETIGWDTSVASQSPATACDENRSDQFIVAYYDSYNTQNGTTLGPPGANDSWAAALGQVTDCVPPANAKFWPNVDANGDALISLTAGQKYYLQLEHVNQTGGYAENVNYKFAGDVDPLSPQGGGSGEATLLTGANIAGLVGFTPSVSIALSNGSPVVTYWGVLLSGTNVNGITNSIGISSGGPGYYTPPAGDTAEYFQSSE
jgi:hypothetical protein